MPAKKKVHAKRLPRKSPKLYTKEKPMDAQMGYFMLMAAVLALLVSFHFAHDRLGPKTQAATHEMELGK